MNEPVGCRMKEPRVGYQLGEDSAGIGAHIAARVMDQAGSGEVVDLARSKTWSWDRAYGSMIAVQDRSERPRREE